ncbi:MAG: permease-like cell division protein FtsX [Patescibacteria group bacterium]
MILLQTTRAIRFALQNFRRNLWLSIVTIIIIAVAVFSVSLVAALNVLGHRALATVEQRVDVTLELVPSASEADIATFVERLQNQPLVASVAYLSKTDALEAFKRNHANDANIQNLLAELTDNPLPASVTLKAKRIADYDSILAFVDLDENAKFVADSKRDFKDSQLVIEKLTTLTDRVRDIGFLVSSVFAFLSLIVVFNTIRIAIYTHREEIGIMRLVGASNAFIRSPFIIESVLYSVIGAGLAITLLVLLWQGATPTLHKFFFKDTTVNLGTVLQQNLWTIVGWQFLGALLLSTFSSTIATRRYLKV